LKNRFANLNLRIIRGKNRACVLDSLVIYKFAVFSCKYTHFVDINCSNRALSKVVADFGSGELNNTPIGLQNRRRWIGVILKNASLILQLSSDE
jgi:hypothetical protein